MPVTRKRPTVPRLRGLPASRHGALALALLCAIGAAIILVVALGNYRQTLKNSSVQDTVLIAKARIQKGTSGAAISAAGMVKPTPIVQKSLAVGAITDAAQLQGKVAAHDIMPGAQLTLADFTSSVGISGQLAPTHRAVLLAVDEPHGLLGTLQVGDRVDIYGTYDLQQNGGGNSVSITKLVVPNALILQAPSAGSSSGPGASSSGQSGDVLLDVSGDDAGRLVFTAENAKVYMTLRPANAKSVPDPLTTMDTIVTDGKLKVIGGTLLTLKFPRTISVSESVSSNGVSAKVTGTPPTGASPQATTTATGAPPTTTTTPTTTTASSATHKTGSHK